MLHGLSTRQKIAAAGLALTAIFGVGAAGNSYLNSTQNKPVQRPANQAKQSFFNGSGPGGVAGQTKGRSSKSRPRPAYGSVNINTGTQEDLESLPGIGPALAQRILQYRTSSGGFRSLDELDNVKGIGPKKLEEIRPYCRL
ncbi:MAG: helix-hairpin-helix domain-containing protein [Armatimonadetes bacterium]|nr:helix-hairpin-helix domain-containing protein [Armatimonadota bacterium]